jgi:glycosyltransferase involved in cell wall biosynthesis
MNSSSPLCLCLIVKNEAKYLEKCVSSVRSIVSQIIIVDTGSNDHTLEIAKTLTDEFYQIAFQNDFSQARNIALNYAKTPWILFLDADESFEPMDANNLLKSISETSDNIWGYQLTRYNFFGTGGWYTSKNLKVFRNSPLIKYEGTVSESVTQAIKKNGGRIEDAPVLLNHYGHCRDAISRNNKAYFYLNLMEEEVKKQLSNTRLMGYMGMILRTLGRFEEALDISEKGMLITPNSSHSNYCRAQVLRSVGRDEEALFHYEKAVELNPEDPTALNMVGLMNMTLKNYEAAEKAFLKICSLNPLLIHVHVNLGLLYLAKEDIVHALEHFEKVVDRNKGFLHEEFFSRLECDPYREFYYETIFKYCGLGYCIAYCKEKMKDNNAVFYHGYTYAEELSVT